MKSTRTPLTQRGARIAVIVLGGAWSGACTVARGDDAASGVLKLVSGAYELGGQKVPRVDSFLPYVPVLRTDDLKILKVAALAAVWERVGIEHGLASASRGDALQKMIPSVPGNGRFRQQLESRNAEFDEHLAPLLIKALDRGALNEIAGENILASLIEGKGSPAEAFVDQGSRASAEEYRLKAAYLRMQGKLYEKAKAVAAAHANRGAFDGDKVRVFIHLQTGTGTYLILENRSAADLHNVSLTAVAKVPPLPQRNDPPDLVKGVGAGLAGASGIETPRRMQIGVELEKSVRDFDEARSAPSRLFVHAPVVPAGQSVRVAFLMPGVFNTRVDPPTYSVWTDEGSRENQVVGGLDEVRAQAAKNRQKFAGPPPRRSQNPGPGIFFRNAPAPRSALATRRPGMNAPIARRPAIPPNPQTVRQAYEQAAEKARTRLLHGFDEVIKRVEANPKAVRGSASQVIARVKEEKRGFENNDAIPWSEAMRTRTMAYLAELGAARTRVLTSLGASDVPSDLSERIDRRVLARWAHRPWQETVPGTVTLYSSGKVNFPDSEHTWSYFGGRLTLRWRNEQAPGGYWVDTCVVSADGLSFHGSNQRNVPINGTLKTE